MYVPANKFLHSKKVREKPKVNHVLQSVFSYYSKEIVKLASLLEKQCFTCYNFLYVTCFPLFTPMNASSLKQTVIMTEPVLNFQAIC